MSGAGATNLSMAIPPRNPSRRLANKTSNLQDLCNCSLHCLSSPPPSVPRLRHLKWQACLQLESDASEEANAHSAEDEEELRRLGHGKDHRPDLLQVVIWAAAEDFNDSVLGRTLDKIFDADKGILKESRVRIATFST